MPIQTQRTGNQCFTCSERKLIKKMTENERALPNSPQTKGKKRKIFKKFCDSTSLHGYSYLYIANSTVMKSVWTLVIIGMSGVGIAFLVINTDAYVRSRLVTNIESSTADLSVSINEVEKTLF